MFVQTNVNLAGRRLVAGFGKALSAAAFACLLGGCLATAGVEGEVVYGYPAVHVETVPVAIETYPRVYYRGSYAYLVGERWYYPTSRGWVTFREEPRELGRYRVDYERRAGRGRYRTPARPEYTYPPERGRYRR